MASICCCPPAEVAGEPRCMPPFGQRAGSRARTARQVRLRAARPRSPRTAHVAADRRGSPARRQAGEDPAGRSGAWAMPGAGPRAPASRPPMATARPASTVARAAARTRPETACAPASTCRPRWRPPAPRISPGATATSTSHTHGAAPPSRAVRSPGAHASTACARLPAEIGLDHPLVRPDLRGRAFGDPHPEIHHHDPVGQPHDQAHVVLDQQHAQPVLAQRLHPFAQHGRFRAVQAGRGLVQQQHARLLHHRPRQLQRALLPIGQGAHLPPQRVLQGEALQQRLRPLP